MENTFEIVVITFQGMEDLVERELIDLGINNTEKQRRAVKCTVSKKELYKLNLHLRTAVRILVPIAEFNAKTDEQLYNSILNINWLDYLNTRKTFTVDCVVQSNFFKQPQLAALKARDGVADKFRKELGAKPEVDPIDPHIRINLTISDNKCTVSLDSSGDPLFKRGYRTGQHPAQLNECLAAGLILRSGWNKTDTFIDPMCGSGTLPIEAALIGYNIPPGIFRQKFGFEKWLNFDRKLYKQVFDEIDDESNVKLKIYGIDVNKKFAKLATDNCKNASLGNKISIINNSMEDFELPEDEKGVVLMNPPYGERLKPEDTDDLYQHIGDQLKNKFKGYDAWVLSSNFAALKQVGLKATDTYFVNNGTLECKYVNYAVLNGSKVAEEIEETETTKTEETED